MWDVFCFFGLRVPERVGEKAAETELTSCASKTSKVGQNLKIAISAHEKPQMWLKGLDAFMRCIHVEVNCIVVVAHQWT